MRLYHFLPTDYALDDLRRGRLKIAQIDQLNDPFELWCANQRDRPLRAPMRRWKDVMAKHYGLLCFCAGWHNPLLWSHYADRHRGICLGFDVADDFADSVRYVKSRTPLSLPLSRESMKQLLFTKFSGWSYEEEWRVWARLEERDHHSNHYFYDFEEQMTLREVIAGPLCAETKAIISEAAARYPDVELIKARLAVKSFSVVRNKRGFRR